MHPIDRLIGGGGMTYEEWEAILDRHVRDTGADRYAYAYGRVSAMLASLLAGDSTIEQVRERLLVEEAGT